MYRERFDTDGNRRETTTGTTTADMYNNIKRILERNPTYLHVYISTSYYIHTTLVQMPPQRTQQMRY